LSVILSAAGSCGVFQGVHTLASEPPPRPVVTTTETPNVDEARQAAATGYQNALDRAPQRKLLAGTNIVVSVLFVVGGLMLFSRRASAPWWITQAVLANVLWVIGDTVSRFIALAQGWPELEQLYEMQARAERAAQPDGGLSQFEAAQPLAVMITFFVAGALLRIVLYSWFAWRARRADIGTLIASAARERDS
jgi:small-conductance mechanosensitive channel